MTTKIKPNILITGLESGYVANFMNEQFGHLMTASTLTQNGNGKADLLMALDSRELNYKKKLPITLIIPGAPVVLNLHDSQLVELTNQVTIQNTYWIAFEDPRKILGLLLDYYQGGYYDSVFDRFVFSTRSDIEFYLTKRATNINKEIRKNLLSAITALKILGFEQTEINKALNVKEKIYEKSI